MSRQSLVSEWECTPAIQEELIQLHSTDKKKWHTKVATMIRQHPIKFGILTVGTHDDGDNELTFEEFKEHFQGAIENEKLLRLIYDDMDHSDATHIKFVAIHRWLNAFKVRRQSEVVKDHKWLFVKLQPVQAAHLDDDGSGEVDRNEFITYFTQTIGIDEALANAIFEDIDVNHDGDLSIMEYTRWKSKHNKSSKLKKFFDAQRASSVTPVPPPALAVAATEEEKCADCEQLKVDIKQLQDQSAASEKEWKQKVDVLSQTVDALKKKSASAQKSVVSTQSAVGDSGKREQALHKDIVAMKKENEKLASAASDSSKQFERQIKALRQEMDALKKASKSSAGDSAKHAQALESRIAAFKLSKDQMDAIKKASKAPSSAGDSAKHAQALESQIAAFKAEIAKLTNEAKSATATHSDKEKTLQLQIEALKQDNASSAQSAGDSGQREQALKAEIEKLKRDNGKLSKDQQDIRSAAATHAEKEKTLQASVAALRTEKEQLVRDAELNKTARTQSEQQLQQESSEASAKQQQTVQSLRDENDVLKTSLEDERAKHKTVVHASTAQSAKRDEAEQELRHRVSALQAEGEAKETQLVKAKQQIKELSVEVVELKETKAAQSSEASTKQQQTEQTVQSLRDENDMLKTSLEDERAKHKTVVQASTAQSAKRDEAEQQLRHRVSTLQAEGEANETQLIKVKQQIKELSVDVVELKETKAAQTQQVAKLKVKVSKRELECNAKDTEIGELRKKVSDNDEKAEIGLAQQKRLQKEIAELDETIQSQNRKIKELKRELSKSQEQNDEYAVNLKTKGEEIALLKQSMESRNTNDAAKLKSFRAEIAVLTEDIERHQKEVKRVRAQMEEEQENADKISKEKRAVKAALSEKEGEIALLQHQLQLTQQNTDLAESTDNDQIRKLKQHNKTVEDELMQQKIEVKTLKDRYADLEQDLEHEKQSIVQLKVQIETERANTANAVRLKQTEADKHQNEVRELEDDKDLLKQELASNKSLVETYKSDKEKLAVQKDEMADQQSALMQQMDAVNNSSVKSQETVQMQLSHFRKKCTTLEKEQEGMQSRHKEEVARKSTQIEQLEGSTAVLTKKLKTQKNNLDKVLREIVHNQAQQQQADKAKVVRKTTKSKHDLSRPQIQIEILNSEAFRTSSLLLIGAYHKIEENKFFGFLDFVQTDLDLDKVFATLKIPDDLLPPLKVSAFLSVIVKLYTLRLQKMRNSGKKQNKNENDRRIFEHFGVWVIRTHSKKLSKQQSVTVLDDLNNSIAAKYDMYEGVVTKQQISDEFAQWCFEYVHANGCHADSKLK